MKKFKKVSIQSLLAVCGFVAMSSSGWADIMPVWSAYGYGDAAAQCTSPNPYSGLAPGSVIGQGTDTSTAVGGQFFLVVCARPSYNGGTVYIPAWSALSIENAQERCETPSVTTGLDAGYPVGRAVYANAGTSYIYVLPCDRRGSYYNNPYGPYNPYNPYNPY